jgi:hypothetical protein
MKCVCFIVSFILVFTVSILGMAQHSKDEITIPHKNFRAIITDIDGVTTEGENITFNDQTVVHARRGSTSVFIPLARLASIEFLANEQVISKELEEIGMRLILKDGSVYETTGLSHHEITGESDFGRFRIRLDRVRRIELPPSETTDD